MRISDWSSDVCSSDLLRDGERRRHGTTGRHDEGDLDSGCGGPGGARVARALGADQESERGSRSGRSEERRVGKSVSVRVDLGGRRIIKTTNYNNQQAHTDRTNTPNKT